jgi:hypothetical protein
MDRHGFLLIMRHIDGCDAYFFLEIANHLAHFKTKFCIQIRERFIHQKNIRFDNEGPGQSHPLLLTSRQAFRHPIFIVMNLHQLQELIGCLLYLRFWEFPVFQPEFYILLNRVVRKNGIVLENHTDVSPADFHFIDASFIKEKGSPLNGVESRNHPQQGCLAASRWPQKGKEFLVFNIEGQVWNNRVFPVLFNGIFNCDLQRCL